MALPKYVNIKDSTTLVRDTFSMGVINTNTNALHEYKCRRAAALQKLADERRRDKELYTLRKEVAELKELVQQILGAVKVM
jgi:hypothetical protein